MTKGMTSPTIIIYGADWCPDCRRAKKFLAEQLMPYQWVDIDDNPPAQRLVEKLNNGNRSIPSIIIDSDHQIDLDNLPGSPKGYTGVVPDVSVNNLLVEPSNAELARALGLSTQAKCATYDLVIIGGGPAGLTAAIYAAREGMEVLLIERSALGGQAALTNLIENFPGFPEGISGTLLGQRFAEQSRRWGVEILQAQEVEQIEIKQKDSHHHTVHLTDGQRVQGRALLLATGATYRRLDVPGEDALIGSRVHFCATCDGPFYRGSELLVVVGGGNSEAEEALHLTQYADEVYLLVRSDSLTASQTAIEKVTHHPKIRIFYNTKVDELVGDNTLEAIHARRDGEATKFHPDAVFIFIGMTPNSDLLRGKVSEDARGFLLTGHDLLHTDSPPAEPPRAYETSERGIFAAGDVRHGATAQIASAVGEGAAVAISIRDYLREVE